jgi:leucyl-tRNA synthetase
MELVNALGKLDTAGNDARAVMQEGLEVCTLLLAPIVPHCTESMWAALGHDSVLATAAWPVVDTAALARAEIEVVVQVNGQAVAEAGEGAAYQQRFLLPMALQEAGRVEASWPVQFERSCGHVRPLIGYLFWALQFARTHARDR